MGKNPFKAARSLRTPFLKRLFSYFFTSLLLASFLLVNNFQFVAAQDADTPTASATEEPPTAAPSDTSLPTDTPTSAPTDTETPTLDFSPTASDTELFTATPTQTLDLTQSSTPTETETPTPTETGTLTETPTETPSPTLTETPTATLDSSCTGLGVDALCQTAQDLGQVRVVVQLDMAYKPVGQLSDSQENAQENRIADNQDALAEDLGQADVQADPVQEFETIPYVAYVVDEAGLAELAQSPLVSNIFEDQPRTTDLDQSVPLIGAQRLGPMGPPARARRSPSSTPVWKRAIRSSAPAAWFPRPVFPKPLTIPVIRI
jgi:hypothetical protein